MKLGVQQRLSPIKAAILIKPGSKDRFKHAMQLCFSVWGGIFWPIFPYHKRFSNDFREKYRTHLNANDFYTGAINNYDPDFIIYDSTIPLDDIKKISGDRTLISWAEFIKGIRESRIPFGVTITEIFRAIIDKEFKYRRLDSLQIVIPKTRSRDLYAQAFVGSLLPEVFAELSELLHEKHISSVIDIKDTFEQNYWQNCVNILDANLYSIQTSGRRFWRREQILFLIDTNSLEDLTNFWNLRALGWSIMPIPFDQLTKTEITNFLRNYCQSFAKDQSQMLSFIVGFTIKKKSFDEFRNLLGNLLSESKLGKMPSFQPWLPRFWEGAEVGQYDKTNCPYFEVADTYDTIKDDEGYFRFKAVNLPFEVSKFIGSQIKYKIAINYTSHDFDANIPTAIYGIDSKDWVTLTHASSFREHWRISKSGLLFFCNSNDEEISFFAPESSSFFKKYFSHHHYVIDELPAGKLSKELIKNLRGQWGAQILMSKASMQILDSFENGNSVLWERVIAQINRYKPKGFDSYPERFIENLLDRKVIELGVEIQCKTCNQRSFYLPNVLGHEMVKCNVCQNTFDIPKSYPKNDYKWAYRGLGPFSRNNKVSGLLCQISALRLFSEEFASSHFGSISSLMNFGLRKKKEFEQEIDLAILLRDKSNYDEVPDLIFCECKTHHRFNKVDMERMKKIGIAFPKAILAFCTLNDQLDKNEKKLISKLTKYFQKGFESRPENPILILTASELIPEELWKPFEAFGNIHPFTRNNDWLGHFCDITVKQYLGIKTWGEITMEKWQKAASK